MEKHSHCFIITLSGVESIKMLSCYVVYLKLIYYYKSIILQLKKKKRNSHSFPDIPSSESQSLCSFPGSGWAVDIEYRGSDPV